MANPQFGTAVSGNRAKGYGGLEAAPRDPNQFVLQDASVWAVSGPYYFGCETAEPKIEPGFYSCGLSQRGPYFKRMAIKTDDLLRLPDPVCDMLLKEFVKFWTEAPRFAKLGLAAKRGLLLWGPPGSGKTSAVQQMAAHMVRELNGIVVMIGNPHEAAEALALLRRIEPDRPLIAVYEDLDALVDRYGEPELLALLDGEKQVANIVNIATTNYPERLDTRFVDRPGRFDRVTFVDMPHEEARTAYFAAKAPEVSDEIRAEWVRMTEGWSIAHLRELIVATQALGDGAEETIERLNDMRENVNSSRPPEYNGAGVPTLVRGGQRLAGFGR